MRRRGLIGAATLLALGLAACGSDDGATVRTVGGTDAGSASASGSASAPASGSASAPASGSASGSAVACEPVGDPADAETTVVVTLDEWSVRPESEVPAGTVALEADNVGAEPHELVVVAADGVDSLPTDEDGAFDEAAFEGEIVGEVEGFPSGETCTGVFDLDPGDYVFLCNLVEQEEDGSVEAHFAEGMAYPVTVGG